MKFIGWSLIVVGITSLVAVQIIGLILCFQIASQVSPTLAYLGLWLFPVLLVVAPFYALLAWGVWIPLALIYGGSIISFSSYYFGQQILESRLEKITNVIT